MEGYSIIKQVLDKYFTFCKEPGEEYSLAAMTESIPILMLDKTKPEDESGYSFWLPLESNVTETDLQNLEALYRHPLPGAFRYFLQQRYFVQLFLDTDIDFFSNLPGLLESEFSKTIETYYATLPGRKYLPFARFRNYGVLAFNAGKNAAGNEYEIVILDHEDGYQATELYATDFVTMFQRIDTTLDEKIKQITSYRDNS